MSNSLHGNVPDKSHKVLLLIDVINDLEFEDGTDMFPAALEAARKVAELKAGLMVQGVPTVYVNDNFGKWQSDFHDQIEHVIDDKTLGAPIAELLRPNEGDYFVLKPEHSGFYNTPLELLLRNLKAKEIILAGYTTEMCVLFTAMDAYMRGFNLVLPRDCVASVDEYDNVQAIDLMERTLKASIVSASELSLK